MPHPDNAVGVIIAGDKPTALRPLSPDDSPAEELETRVIILPSVRTSQITFPIARKL